MNGQKSNSKLGGVAALVLAVVAMLGSGVRASADGGDRHRTSDEAIVGFWQVTFKDATNGQVVSYVWDAWHSDRTEIQNDSGRTIAGNVCQGAWAPLGNRTYGLTHPAFIFSDPAHPEFGWTEDNEGDFVNASCVILERVTVDDSGSNYAGTGLIKCVASVDPYDPTAQVLSTQNLTITGKRVTVEVSQLPPARLALERMAGPKRPAVLYRSLLASASIILSAAKNPGSDKSAGVIVSGASCMAKAPFQ